MREVTISLEDYNRLHAAYINFLLIQDIIRNEPAVYKQAEKVADIVGVPIEARANTIAENNMRMQMQAQESEDF